MDVKTYTVLLLIVSVLLVGCTQSGQEVGVLLSAESTYPGRPITLTLLGLTDAYEVEWDVPFGVLREINAEEYEWSPPIKPGEYSLSAIVKGPRFKGTVLTPTVTVKSFLVVPADTVVHLELLAPIGFGDVAIGDRFPVRVTGDVTIDGIAVFTNDSYGVVEVVFAERYRSTPNKVALGLAIRDVQLVDGRLVRLNAEHTEEMAEFGAATMFLDGSISYLVAGLDDSVIPLGTKIAGSPFQLWEINVDETGVAKHPEAARSKVVAVPSIGVEVVGYDQVISPFFSEGVKIIRIAPGSSGSVSELREGDRIVGVKDYQGYRTIKNAQDFTTTVRSSIPGEFLHFHVKNMYNEREVPVEVELLHIVTD